MREKMFRFAALVFVVMLPFSAFAAQEPVAGMTVTRSGVDFGAARVDNEALTLIVTDQNGETVLTREYRGNNISIRGNDLRGAADGTYNYEIRVTPRVSASVRAQQAAARAANDDASVRAIQRANGIANATIQSGVFQIAGGAFVPNDQVEPDANDLRTEVEVGNKSTVPTVAGRPGLRIEANDQVIPDDLIVQGSTCTGLDCVNNESFGFDTLRLKENNLRIHFDDTSSSAGFPNNDWRLAANDSASGGANKFFIEDSTNARNPFTITAAAPANSIFVASNGKVGFRNSSPGLDLHMTTSDTPAVRFEQTNAGGFTAQTWDIGANEANFFVRDLTGGSRLSFRIRPGAPTSSIDIAASGNVGIGTASPAGKLHVVATTASMFLTEVTAAIKLQTANADATAVRDLYINPDGGNVGIGTITPASKFHVSGGDIRVSSGSFIDDGTTLNVPDYVFEDTYKLMPIEELASFVKTERHLPNVPSAKDIAKGGVNLSRFQMNLLEKVEELTLYTLDQHEQISSLKTENEKLMERLAALEAKLSENKQ